MANNTPSPWTVVNEYTKTVVTVGAGFLAFTVTFSSQLFDPKTIDLFPLLLLVFSWFSLVFSIACALRAAGRLTSYLIDPTQDTRKFILPANIAYVSLLIAAFVYFIFAITATFSRDINSEPYLAEKCARRYFAYSDSVQSTNATMRKAIWDNVSARWQFMYVGIKDTAFIDVDPKKMTVTRFQRLP